MPNLSWLFYKGYYEGFKYWLSQKKENEAAIEAFFKARNKLITEAEIPAFEMTDREGCHSFELTTTYPGLLIGSGYTHETGKVGELKLGFQFDFTYGLPIIPGSSIKGVIRSAFPQFKPLKKQPWKRDLSEKETGIKNEKAKYIGNGLLKWELREDELFDKVHELEQYLFEGLNIEASKKEEQPVYDSLYRRDIFYDAFPVKGGGEGGKKLMGMDAITPHGTNPLKNPTPLPFIKLLPQVAIQFVFKTNAPDCFELTWDRRMKLYHDILVEFGAGAKTNVGYGQFKEHTYLTQKEKIQKEIARAVHGGITAEQAIEINRIKKIKIKNN